MRLRQPGKEIQPLVALKSLILVIKSPFENTAGQAGVVAHSVILAPWEDEVGR